MEELIDALEWCKNQGHTGADAALDNLSTIINKKMFFKENIWSGGAYYTIITDEN